MSKQIEVRLRIPNTKHRPLDANGYPLDYSAFRFRNICTVPALPKSGETLELSTASGTIVPATVVRADWSDDLGLFVVSCQYAKRTMSLEEYTALADDPKWELTPLI